MPINYVAYYPVTLSLPCHCVCYLLNVTANRNNVLLTFLSFVTYLAIIWLFTLPDGHSVSTQPEFGTHMFQVIWLFSH